MSGTLPRLLGGRYEIGGEIGRGGMAVVYRGRDVRLDRPVAVKVLRASLADDDRARRRFQREAQAAAGLSHPSVVAVYDTGADVVDGGSVPYLVTEHVAGVTLRQLLDAGERPLPERAVEITAAIVEALACSHRAGIVHRDIKSANVMLTPAGEVKVMDFGIAGAVDDTSTAGTQPAGVFGTAHYLAPERARGEGSDSRSDLYSTGCVLYELLTGAPPFTGKSAVAIVGQHIYDDPAPPSRRDAALPAWADELVAAALAKDPDQRYQTAEQLRLALDRVLEPEPSRPRKPALAALPGRGRAWLIAVAAVVALGGAAPFGIRYLPAALSAQATAPDLIGHSRQAARHQLRRLDLNATVSTEYTAAQRKGQVFRQSPRPGQPVDESGTVHLVVAKGTPVVQVPPTLVGLSKAKATARLGRLDLAVGQVTVKPSTKPKGRVLSLEPAPGSEVSRDISVNLVVSTGPVHVPTLAGQPRHDAVAALQEAGLQVDALTRQVSGAPAGQVLATDPRAGAAVAPGAGVDLVISTGLVPVPELTGMSRQDATARLQEAGLQVGTVIERTSNQPEGQVLATDPDGQAPVAPGADVDLVISTGPPPRPTSRPEASDPSPQTPKTGRPQRPGQPPTKQPQTGQPATEPPQTEQPGAQRPETAPPG